LCERLCEGEKKRVAMERDGALPLLFSFSTTLPFD
jgi:hypothetical protein